MKPIKTPSDLKAAVEKTGSLFFSRNNMKFSGDTMKNYKIQKTIINTCDGKRLVYVLSRKMPVKHGLKDYAFFDAETFKKVNMLGTLIRTPVHRGSIV